MSRFPQFRHAFPETAIPIRKKRTPTKPGTATGARCCAATNNEPRTLPWQWHPSPSHRGPLTNAKSIRAIRHMCHLPCPPPEILAYFSDVSGRPITMRILSPGCVCVVGVLSRSGNLTRPTSADDFGVGIKWRSPYLTRQFYFAR